MESRLLKYKKKQRKPDFMFYCVLSSIILLFCSAVLLSKFSGTYAWFAAKSTATGTIHNAGTTDLVNIKVGKIKYLGQCTIRSTISVKNISNIKIPIKIKLVNPNGQEKPVAEITLAGNTEFSSEPAVINLQEEQCSNENLGYRVIGFKSYINEWIPLKVDKSKLQAPTANPAINQVNTNNNTPAPSEAASGNSQKNITSTDISNQGSNSVNTPAAAANTDTVNSAANGIGQAPQEVSTVGNGSVSMTVAAPGNQGQTQGTESAPVQP
jgi:hypothetical protein